jgi:ion channel-forming bestrophin family protein
MIKYHTKDWFRFLFRFHKTDTIRQLFPMIVIIGLYAAGIAWLEVSFFKLSEGSHVRNISLMHGLLGFVISMLLVFRTNTAYDRWWEGRRLWGSLINVSRNLSTKLAAIFADQPEQCLYFGRMIPAFSFALRNHLRAEHTRLAMFDTDELAHEFKIDYTKHVPNQIVLLIQQRITQLHTQQVISDAQLWSIQTDINQFLDICGACERIKNTPIPFSYSAFLKKFIFIYVITLPFGYVFSLGYYVVPVVAFIFYVLASLELIAEEIEEPFGGDANDLPMERMAQTILSNVRDLFGLKSVQSP